MRGRLPYGQLPVAKIGGVNICQSMAIARSEPWPSGVFHNLILARCLAEQFDLAGRTNLERAQADEIVDSLNDLVETRAEAIKSEDGGKVGQFMAETVPDILVCWLRNL